MSDYPRTYLLLKMFATFVVILSVVASLFWILIPKPPFLNNSVVLEPPKPMTGTVTLGPEKEGEAMKTAKTLCLVESRWRKWSDRPHPGEVFVGRKNAEVYPHLWVMGKEYGDVQYFNDRSTHLSQASDIFTHWLPVGEEVTP